MKWKSVFSYYGGKSKIIDSYPEPTHDLIIEPFAGAAAYAFRWARRGSGRTAWLNDLDERTASIWEFLLSPDASDWVERTWPERVAVGSTSSDYLPSTSPTGLIELFRAEANQGTQGAKGVHSHVTSMGATCWPRTKRKFLEIIPEISHWRFTRRDYSQIPGHTVATWFVDPPYSNLAGSRYRSGSDIDYNLLSDYCRGLAGQVIVCENSGADWLPFEPFEHRRVSIRSRYQKADSKEVMWTNSPSS